MTSPRSLLYTLAKLLALPAADPKIRDDVVFVNAFGPYFDARDLLMQLAIRSRIYQGNSELWDPDRLTLRVFANELTETLEDPRGQQALSRLFLECQDVPEASGLNSCLHMASARSIMARS